MILWTYAWKKKQIDRDRSATDYYIDGVLENILHRGLIFHKKLSDIPPTSAILKIAIFRSGMLQEHVQQLGR